MKTLEKTLTSAEKEHTTVTQTHYVQILYRDMMSTCLILSDIHASASLALSGMGISA